MFNSAKKLIEGLVSTRAKKFNEREELIQELEDHQTLPLPLEDYIALLCGLVDEVGHKFPKDLRLKTDFLEVNPLKKVNTSMFNIMSSRADTTTISPDALVWCFREEFKRGITEAVKTWDWPKKVGLPRTERIKRVEKISKDIDRLTKEIQEFDSQAEQAGVVIRGDRIAKPKKRPTSV